MIINLKRSLRWLYMLAAVKIPATVQVTIKFSDQENIENYKEPNNSASPILLQLT
jgi:hypothetical protein